MIIIVIITNWTNIIFTILYFRGSKHTRDFLGHCRFWYLQGFRIMFLSIYWRGLFGIRCSSLKKVDHHCHFLNNYLVLGHNKLCRKIANTVLLFLLPFYTLSFVFIYTNSPITSFFFKFYLIFGYPHVKYYFNGFLEITVWFVIN